MRGAFARGADTQEAIVSQQRVRGVQQAPTAVRIELAL